MNKFNIDNPVVVCLGNIDNPEKYIGIDSQRGPLRDTEVEGIHFGINVIDKYGHSSLYPTQSVVRNIKFGSDGILLVFEDQKSNPWVFTRMGFIDLPAQYCISKDNGTDMEKSNQYIIKYLRSRMGLK